MHLRKPMPISVVAVGLALTLVAVAVAQDRVTVLEDMIGARGAAIDSLTDRGYTYIRTEKGEEDSYSYWRDTRTGRCVIARVTDGEIASIVYAPDMDCDKGGAAGSDSAAAGKDQFNTICGVITGGQTYRYRCQVTEMRSEAGKRITALKYPDNELKLHWHRGNNVGVSISGVETVQTTYSTSEGETDFELDGKTYFYISDRKAARMELKNFKD